jgi:hypothetical protein
MVLLKNAQEKVVFLWGQGQFHVPPPEYILLFGWGGGNRVSYLGAALFEFPVI